MTPEPSLSIGLVDGPAEYLFSGIAGAVRTGDGGVAVAVRAFHEIRRFGPDGKHLWTAGRLGEGPGEFRWAQLLSPCTTEVSIFVHDVRNQTITVLDGHGNLIESSRFQKFPYGLGLTCAPSGRLVFSDWSEMTSEQALFRWRNALAYAEDADSEVEVLRREIPGADRFQILQNGVTVMSGPSMWGRELLFAPTDDGVWMTTGDSYEVEFLDWTGETIRRLRWPGPDSTVTEEHIAAHKEEICRGYELLDADNWEARCAERWRQEAEQARPTFPSVSRLLVAHDGRLWVERFRRPGEQREWLVFSPTGSTWVATLQIPARMLIQDSGTDWVLVRRTTDDLGVESLAVYPIKASYGGAAETGGG